MIHITQSKPTDVSREHHLLIDLGKPCKCLSSAVLGGGFTRSRYVINRSVSKNWRGDDPEKDMRIYAQKHNIEAESCIGLMTAVSAQHTYSHELEHSGWVVKSFVTAGVSNAARAGGCNPLNDALVGTINIIVIVFGSLTEAAMISAVQTATEAKTAALEDGNIRTKFQERATGTTTDAIAIVNYLDAPASAYAGLATPAGYAIGQSVYKATQEALKGT